MKKKFRCLLGLHQYDRKNEKSMLVFEDRGESFYKIENKCIHCGKTKVEIISFPTGR